MSAGRQATTQGGRRGGGVIGCSSQVLTRIWRPVWQVGRLIPTGFWYVWTDTLVVRNHSSIHVHRHLIRCRYAKQASLPLAAQCAAVRPVRGADLKVHRLMRVHGQGGGVEATRRRLCGVCRQSIEHSSVGKGERRGDL